MAIVRLDIDSNKRSALMKENMKSIASLLEENPPKENIARYRTESLIRDDNTLMAYEIIKTECHLLMERVSAISQTKSGEAPPPHLVSCISDIIYASKYLNIKELMQVRKQLRAKFGKAFKDSAMKNENDILNETLVRSLSLEPPTTQTVHLYMQKICKQYNVDWTPTIELAFDDIIVLEPAVTGLGGGEAAPGLNGIQHHQYDKDVFNAHANAIALPYDDISAKMKYGSSTTATTTSSVTSHTSNSDNETDDDDDFDIPPAPSAPPSSCDDNSNERSVRAVAITF